MQYLVIHCPKVQRPHSCNLNLDLILCLDNFWMNVLFTHPTNMMLFSFGQLFLTIALFFPLLNDVLNGLKLHDMQKSCIACDV
jgi:hypothetical protein